MLREGVKNTQRGGVRVGQKTKKSQFHFLQGWISLLNIWRTLTLIFKKIGVDFDHPQRPFKICNPLIIRNFFRSIYRVHGTQNDRLELTVLMQKSVLKNMLGVLRYWAKHAKNRVAKPNLHIFRQFGRYLGTRCIFFNTDFYVETVRSSRSFWVP